MTTSALEDLLDWFEGIESDPGFFGMTEDEYQQRARALTSAIALAERGEYGVQENESLIRDSKPCRGCNSTVRIDAPGWGERCAECGNHGIDLELDDEDE